MSNKLQLTVKTLTDAPNLKAMFELEPVRNNAVRNLMQTRGKSLEEATMHYEREKILFFKALQANNKLETCERFSIYSCWIELFASGLTLNDGSAYIIPYGKIAQFQPGWKGRLDQMAQIPEIVNIPPPQVVYENDEFEFELGEHPRIIKHKPAESHKDKKLTYVYLVIQKKSGNELHIMNRERVLAIRDKYARKDSDLWTTFEEQAWKKTLVKQAWNAQPNKTARMRALDQKVAANFDPEDATDPKQTNDIDYGIVDQETGEVKETPKEQQSDLGNLDEAF